MPLHYCTFSLFPPLDHTCIAVDDHSSTAKVVWRKHGNQQQFGTGSKGGKGLRHRQAKNSSRKPTKEQSDTVKVGGTRSLVHTSPIVCNLTTSQLLYPINMTASVSLLWALPAGQPGSMAVISPWAGTPLQVSSRSNEIFYQRQIVGWAQFEFSLDGKCTPGNSPLEQGRLSMLRDISYLA